MWPVVCPVYSNGNRRKICAMCVAEFHNYLLNQTCYLYHSNYLYPCLFFGQADWSKSKGGVLKSLLSLCSHIFNPFV